MGGRWSAVSVALLLEVNDWLRTPAGRALGVAERAVLREVAWRAHDRTREAWQRKEPQTDPPAHRWMLHEEVGMEPGSLGNLVSRLARTHGVELRVRTGTDKRGRPVYAHRAQQMTYRVPHLMAREGPSQDGLGPLQDGATATEGPSQDGLGPLQDGARPLQDGPSPSWDGPHRSSSSSASEMKSTATARAASPRAVAAPAGQAAARAQIAQLLAGVPRPGRRRPGVAGDT
jgi:hypothetical protein